jgi:hypothetical protein
LIGDCCGGGEGITCDSRRRGNVHRFRREKKPVIFFALVGEDLAVSVGGLGASRPRTRQDLSASHASSTVMKP